MNDDPGPSSAARQLPPRSDHAESDDEHHVSDDHDVPNTEEDSSRCDAQPNQTSASQQREKRREGLAKKLEFVSHLQKSLDMIVFVYICTLYYMECSLIRLLLRLLPHYSFLTPKNGLLLPAEQPHIYTIFIPSILCILAHLFFGLPEAGEASRGYLHGGVVIDFIGQRPPASRLAFLAFDLVILAAQCLMLAVHNEREGLKKAVSPALATLSVSGAGEQMAGREGEEVGVGAGTGTTQDHDAEERGVLRDEANLGMVGDGAGIELQPLAGSGNENRRGDGDGEAADDEQSRGTYTSAAANADMLDILRSGNAVLANFHVIHAVRTVGNGAQSAATYSLRTLGYNATLAALAAERRGRLIRAQQR